DDLPKMFQRYFRARSSTGIAGTGIGLNLVKQIVELHGGTIDVASSRGNGTTFTLRIPIGAEMLDEQRVATG
ncbi:sensor histidine kinase, partial [Pseudomonas sp. BGM005]|nr:sensor histidine kinase [Pseudomonas sp. BG5]